MSSLKIKYPRLYRNPNPLPIAISSKSLKLSNVLLELSVSSNTFHIFPKSPKIAPSNWERILNGY